MKKKILFMLLFVIVIGLMAGCGKKAEEQKQEYAIVKLSTMEATENKVQAALVVDDKNVVSELVAFSDDTEAAMKSLDIENDEMKEAVDKVVGKLIENGEITEETKKIEVTTEDEKQLEEVKEVIEKTVRKYFKKVEIEIDSKLKEYVEEAKELKIAPSTLELIYKLLENDVTLLKDELAKMKRYELLQMYRKQVMPEDFGSKLRGGYEKKKSELQKDEKFIELEKKLKEVYEKIKNFEGTEEELKALEAEKKQIKEEIKELKDTYKSEVQKLREEYRAKAKAELTKDQKEAKELGINTRQLKLIKEILELDKTAKKENLVKLTTGELMKKYFELTKPEKFLDYCREEQNADIAVNDEIQKEIKKLSEELEKAIKEYQTNNSEELKKQIEDMKKVLEQKIYDYKKEIHGIKSEYHEFFKRYTVDGKAIIDNMDLGEHFTHRRKQEKEIIDEMKKIHEGRKKHHSKDKWKDLVEENIDFDINDIHKHLENKRRP